MVTTHPQWVSLVFFEIASNTITFNIGGSGNNLDDFYITALRLEYVGIAQEPIGQNPVPEPNTLMLFGIGLLGLIGVSRKKK